MQSATFKIDGMHCDGCAQTLQALVERERGVQAAAISFKDGEGRILYDPNETRADRLIAVMEQPGFRVTLG